MKRLAIIIGGLLILPAFAEVAPVYYEDIEYSDVVYDEYGNPVYYTDEDESNAMLDENVTKPSASASRNVSGTRSNTNRTTIGRTLPTSNAGAASGRASAANSSRAVAARTTSNSSPRSGSNSRSVASRGTTSRTTSTNATRATSNVAATRAAATRATGGAGRASASSTRAGAGGASTVARTTTTSRSGTSSRVATTGARVNRAATNAAVGVVTTAAPAGTIRATGTTLTSSNQTLRDGGDPLYISNGARVSVASGRGSAAATRSPTIRMASGSSLTTSEVTVTAADLAEMDELAELTDYCKAQYASCMDNYCNVLDDNQGRCSCSANLKNYANAESALKSATEELQEVAQKIQYIGLSAREVETLFTQTEAELKMQSTTDTSQLKTSLDKIKDMIIEVQSGNASSTASSSALSFDLSGLLDFTIDSTGFDLSSFLGGLGTSGNTINNQRGAELFKTATNRCKANVLRACTNQGVDASLITNAYDLEIDKECIAYERSLNDSNDQMVATVRNAKSVLQRARLLVEQSKNEYDNMRDCISALDSCMQDEYVCGSDYEKCLDPSGRYIVNGEIVIGSDPGRAINGRGTSSVGVLNGDICSMNLYNVWNYGSSTPGQTSTSQSGCKNAWNSYSLNGSGNGDLSDYVTSTLGSHTGLGMSEYIQAKIGWKGTGKESDRNYGMCMSVLNKCQDYTYTGTGSSRKYNESNEVVKQYLERILVQIKARQDQILAEHAESCITDVTTCLSQNNYPFDEENVNANTTAANIAINACRSTIVTCMSVNGYSVDNPTPSDLWPWVCGITTGSTDCAGISGGGSGGGDSNTCSVNNLSACDSTTCGNLSGYRWCSDTAQGSSKCRLESQCYSSTTYSYTITYQCNDGTSTQWSQSVSGSSPSISAHFADSGTVTGKCSKSDYYPGSFYCRNSGSSGSFVPYANLNATQVIHNSLTCQVYWEADSNTHTCGPSNLEYCTEANCATNGGTWCYSSSTAQAPQCLKSTQCVCNSNDLTHCSGPVSCLGLGASSYSWCSSSSSGKPQCYENSDKPSHACCFGSTYNCGSEALCEGAQNTWCTDQCIAEHIESGNNSISHTECGGGEEPEQKGSNFNGKLTAIVGGN